MAGREVGVCSYELKVSIPALNDKTYVEQLSSYLCDGELRSMLSANSDDTIRSLSSVFQLGNLDMECQSVTARRVFLVSCRTSFVSWIPSGSCLGYILCELLPWNRT